MTAEKQRLHPLSPLLNGIKTLTGMLAVLSWQGFANFGIGIGSLIVVAAGVAGLVYAWVAWLFTGYELVERELRITEGALVRRHRTIPLQRLQSVEVVQPLLGRLCGLAQLRCEVVGAAKTEAPLSYLALADATRLRQRLLELSKAADPEPEPAGDAVAADEADQPDRVEATVGAPQPVAEGPETPVVRVPTGLLVRSQLLTPQVFALPIALAVTVMVFVFQPDASFYGIAALVSSLLGTLLYPVRQAMGNYDFTLTDTVDGMRIRRGLTERRTQTLPLERVTAVTIRRPLLWRWAGWVHCRVANAGGGATQADQTLGGTLLPVGDHEQARTVTRHTLSGVDLTSVRLIGVPRRARWRSPIGQPALGAGLGERVFVCRRGRLAPELVAVPYARIQSVRVTQGRWQRALRLATVSVDIAGGLAIAPRALHRDVVDALEMATQLRNRSRAAAAAAVAGPVEPPRPHE